MISCIKRTTLLIFFIFSSFTAIAENPSAFEKFRAGQKAYYQGDYATAEKTFTELTAQTGGSGALYYNLGNVALKSQKWGEALQYYEKAKRTLPRNPDLQKNRAVVLNHLDLNPQERFAEYLSGTFYFWLGILSREESKILFLGLSAVFWIFLTLRITRRRHVFNLITVISVLFYGYVAFGTFLKYDTEKPGAFGIVLSTDVAVRGNFLKEAEPVFTAAQGTKVRILEEQSLGGAEKWLKIELAAGQQGWVLAGSVGVI